MAVTTYTKSGNKATSTAKLDKAVFAVEIPNHELLKQAYVAYLANGRTNNATVLKRGEVRGGGRKPWRQKGTGRARFGSTRNPIWRGGGITFGPSGQENYSKKLSLNSKRQALRQALTMADQDNKLIALEDLKFANAKTKEALSLLAKIGVTTNGLLVVDNKTDEIDRATHNLQSIKVVQAKYLNVYDVMNADKIVFTSSALAEVSAWLGKAAKAVTKEATNE